MAKKSNRAGLLVLALVVIAAVIAYVWIHKHRQPAEAPATQPNATVAAGAPLVVAADKPDPANEGRVVQVTGDLKVIAAAHDTQLGVDANAIVLLRYADMLQWQEQCNGAKCTYQQVWSPQILSSKKFREQEGHQNPGRMPVTTGRYSAGEVRLGAFSIDPAALANSRQGVPLPIKPVPYPVGAAQLPSNLAMSFRAVNGMLYAGDPEHRAVGDLRVIYRIIPAGKVEITGVQHGDSVTVQTAKSLSQSP
jgi:hypothetical protein